MVWLGNTGAVTDPKAYATYGPNEYPDIKADFIGATLTAPPDSGSSVLFGYRYPFTTHIEKQPHGLGGRYLTSLQSGEIEVLVFENSGDNSAPLSVPNSYTVFGNATFNSIAVNSGPGETVTLAGTLTATGASAPDLQSFDVAGSTANLTGLATVQTYGDVESHLIVAGSIILVGTTVAGYGQASLLIENRGLVDIKQGGTATTDGVFVGFGTNTGTLTVSGTLTDSDTTNGIVIGVGTGSLGYVYVTGGHVNSNTVSDGGMVGEANVFINDTGTWTNSGTFVVGANGSIELLGLLKTAGLTIDGKASMVVGTIDITDDNGGVIIDKGGALTAASYGVILTPLLATRTGSTVSFGASTITDAGFGAPAVGAGGVMLNGAIDFLNSTISETAGSAGIVVGYGEQGSSTLTEAVTARGASVTTNTTTIGAVLITNLSNQPDGKLTIMGGTWTDSGSGTTMTVGAGGAGFLEVTGGATLSDHDATVSGFISSRSVTSLAFVGSGSTWTIAGSLAVGNSQAQGDVYVYGIVSEAGTLTVDAPSDDASRLTVAGPGTLSVSNDILLGGNGAGSGALLVERGGAVNTIGTVHIVNGYLDVDGDLRASSLVDDDRQNGGENYIDIDSAGDVTLAAGGVASLGAGTRFHITGGKLYADSIAVGANGQVSGNGFIQGSAGDAATTTIDLTYGGTLIADGGQLLVQGSVHGGFLSINSGSELAVTGSIDNGAMAAFSGSGGDLSIGAAFPSMTVLNFASGDLIDVGVFATTAALDPNGTLDIYNGSGASATLVDAIKLGGTINYANATFNVDHLSLTQSEITFRQGGTGTPSGVTAPTPSVTSPTLSNQQDVSVSPIQDPTATDTTQVSATVGTNSGLLGASVSGGGTLIDDGTILFISGTLAQVNAALGTLTYTGTAPGSDTLTLDVEDDQAFADSQSTTFNVADPGVTLAVPGAQTIAATAGATTSISGLAATDLYTDPTATYSFTLTDATGALSAIQEGGATVSGNGGATLTVSGDLDSINRTLATLTYIGVVGAGAAAADTIDIAASDAFGGASSATIDIAITQPATATETDWATASDGDAGTAANWTAGTPTAALTAVATPGYYVVSGAITAGQFIVAGDPIFTGSVTADGTSGDFQTFLVSNQSGATFDGGTLSTGSVVIGGTTSDVGALNLTNGASVSLSGSTPTGSAEAAYVGYAASSNGAVSVDASTLTAGEGLAIGFNGAGYLSITSGGTVSTTDQNVADGLAGAAVGYGTSAVGGIEVDGAGSSLSTDGFLEVGVAGSAGLDIADGGHVTSDGPSGQATGVLGFSAGGQGYASLDGAGSSWDVTQTFVAGYAGFGLLDISNGGSLEVDGPYLRIGRDAGSVGYVHLEDSGSTIDAPNTALYVGRDGFGSLSVSGGATATVGSAILAQDAGSGGEVTIDSGGVLNVLGALTTGGASADIEVDGGTIGTAGGFDLATAGGSANLTIASGGAISGGVTLGDAIMSFDPTSQISGAITIDGGAFGYNAGSVTSAYTLDNPITVLGASSKSEILDGSSSLLLTGTIAFVGPADATLQIYGQGIAIDGPITGFAAGDELQIENLPADGSDFSAEPVAWQNGTLTLSDNSGDVLETLLMPGNYAGAVFNGYGNSGEVDVTLACFASGTCIMTDRGPVEVQRLRVGDRVRAMFHGPFAPVVWLGHRRVACARHPRPWDVMPVRVSRDAFGPGMPDRELLLSPDHASHIDGVLIPIRYLLNDATIVQTEVETIDYWHVELSRHDVLFAEGLPAESYLDTGNRGAFDNGGGAVELHADFAMRVWGARSCAKLVLDGPELEAARSWTLEQARRLGHAMTCDPDLRLLAGGVELRPIHDGYHYRFELTRPVNSARLASRSFIPAHMRDGSADRRRLGVAVTRIRCGSDEVSLSDPRLRGGWRGELESDAFQAWRWTDGDAELILAGLAGPLEVSLAPMALYWAEDGHAAFPRSASGRAA